MPERGRWPRIREIHTPLFQAGLELHVLHASSEHDFDTVFAALARRRVGALLISPDILFNARSEQLAALTIRHAVPAIFQYREDLKAAFEKHEGETEEQVARLQRVFEAIEKKPQGKKCPAIDGIIEEGQEIIKEYKGSPALDSGLLAAAQAVEHYEISRYGTLRTWAQELGLHKPRAFLRPRSMRRKQPMRP